MLPHPVNLSYVLGSFLGLFRISTSDFQEHLFLCDSVSQSLIKFNNKFKYDGKEESQLDATITVY